MEPSTITIPKLPPDAQAADMAHLYLAGAGSVGKTLLRQLSFRSAEAPRIQIIGACTSRRAIWGAEGLSPARIPRRLLDGAPTDWNEILPHLEREAPRPLIFVDATGSIEVAGYHERLLEQGIHVATSSKLACTRKQTYFDRLVGALEEIGARYRFETTVGAGLPIVQTVRDLVATGDRIREIRGAVSGTLTFLFSAMREGASFSEGVREAAERGFAEPDPRDDLSGEDVARKFIILARTAGFRIERADIQVESLVPAALREIPAGALLDYMAALDDGWANRLDRADAKGCVLQYAGHLTDGRVTVGVQPVAPASALGQLRGTDNLFEIYTDRYAASPLTVRGPGAGPDVTASGLLSDVLKIARAVTERAH